MYSRSLFKERLIRRDFETVPSLSGDRQKFIWAQLILRFVVGDVQVGITGRWDSQTKAGFMRFQQKSNILEPGREGHWTTKTTYALAQVALEWILGGKIENQLGRKNDNLRKAIRRFQRAYRLAVDGKIGPQVRDMMIQIISGHRTGMRFDRHFRLGPLGAALASNNVLTPFSKFRHIYTDFSDPLAVLEVEAAESDAFPERQEEFERVYDGTAHPISQPWLRPFRWICLLIVQFRNPKTGEVRFAPATGFLISPQHVVTAAHVMLLLTRGEVEQRDSLLYAEKIFVIPGFTWPNRLEICSDDAGKKCINTKRPFGWVVVDRSGFNIPYQFLLPKGDEIIQNSSYDFGLLDLGIAIGQRTIYYRQPSDGSLRQGQLGWWGQRGSNSSIRPFRLTAELDEKQFLVSGYPRIFDGKQVYSPGTISFAEQFTAGVRLGDLARATGPNEFVHDADTFGGHSGSPIWEERKSGSATKRRLLGLDISSFERAVFPSVLGSAENLEAAVAWNRDVWQQIREWITDGK